MSDTKKAWEQKFDEHWEVGYLDTGDDKFSHESWFRAGWESALIVAAKIAWDAETHHDAKENIEALSDAR